MLKTLEPVFSEDAITVFFSTSEKFAPFCSAAILSLLDHMNQERYYDIIILDSGMKQSTKELYQQLFNCYENASIRFFPVMEILSGYNLATSRHFVVDCYSRLLIPYILPDYKKAIYLDGDMILMSDIAELFDYDISEVSIGALRVLGFAAALFGGFKKIKQKVTDYFSNVLHISEENWDKYFTTGTLLMNLERMREKYPSYKQVFEYADENSHKFWYLDVDVLNTLYQGDVFLLSQTWGWLAFDKDDTVWWEPICLTPRCLYEEYTSASVNPQIIHYGGPDKPWDFPNRMRAEEFWRVFRRTPFYGSYLEKRILGDASYKDVNQLQKKIEELQVSEAALLSWMNRVRFSMPYRLMRRLRKVFRKGVRND